MNFLLIRLSKLSLLRIGRWCNGAAEFCKLRVNEFLWLGTHNAGIDKFNNVEC